MTHRFAPLPEGTTTETARDELATLNPDGTAPLEMLLEDLYARRRDANAEMHISVWLDWAAQLRLGGMAWNDALNAAAVFYFG